MTEYERGVEAAIAAMRAHWTAAYMTEGAEAAAFHRFVAEQIADIRSRLPLPYDTIDAEGCGAVFAAINPEFGA